MIQAVRVGVWGPVGPGAHVPGAGSNLGIKRYPVPGAALCLRTPPQKKKNIHTLPYKVDKGITTFLKSPQQMTKTLFPIRVVWESCFFFLGGLLREGGLNGGM